MPRPPPQVIPDTVTSIVAVKSPTQSPQDNVGIPSGLCLLCDFREVTLFSLSGPIHEVGDNSTYLLNLLLGLNSLCVNCCQFSEVSLPRVCRGEGREHGLRLETCGKEPPTRPCHVLWSTVGLSWPEGNFL